MPARPGRTIRTPARHRGASPRADRRTERSARAHAASRFEALSAWQECRDCSFIPVCAGGCTVAAYNELGSIDKPNCHKAAIQAGLVSLARQAAAERTATVN